MTELVHFPAGAGKNILRIFTTAMYNNPLLLYREYIQNSADSYDEAKRRYNFQADPAVHINIDAEERRISIKDYGIGVAPNQFRGLMRAIGWSVKDQDTSRGFWGIGRLSGLAFARQLTFRTKYRGSSEISEMHWDCMSFYKYLKSKSSMSSDILVDKVTSFNTMLCDANTQSFFEVILHDIVRHGDDMLLDDSAVRLYLSQVAPVPINNKFKFYDEIDSLLQDHIDMNGISIYINSSEEKLLRPFREEFKISKDRYDEFLSIEPIQIFSDSGISAIGWILHHQYLGAIHQDEAMSGFRARSGNIQIGNRSLLERIFPESRFNDWTVGEIHIIDPDIRPSGDRNSIEETKKFRDLISHLYPVGKNIAKICREHSSARNLLKRFDKDCKLLEETLCVINPSFLSNDMNHKILDMADRKLQHIEALYQKILVPSLVGDASKSRLQEYKRQLRRSRNTLHGSGAQSNMNKSKKEGAVAIDCIYENLQVVMQDDAATIQMIEQWLQTLARYNESLQ